MKSNKDILVPEEAESGWFDLYFVCDASWVVRGGGMLFLEFLSDPSDIFGMLFWKLFCM